MRHIWTGIKALLSAVIIAFAFAVFATMRSNDTVAAFAITGALIGLTVLLWAPTIGQSPWGAASICVMVSLLCAFCTYQGALNGFGLPSDCSARKKLFCHFTNAVYWAIGPAGLTGIGIAVSIGLLWAARSFVKESKESAR
jgi:hypothetical protein